MEKEIFFLSGIFQERSETVREITSILFSVVKEGFIFIDLSFLAISHLFRAMIDVLFVHLLLLSRCTLHFA